MLSVLSRALPLFLAFAASSSAECTLPSEGSATAQVVLVAGTDANGPMKGERTGILVTDTGVILSTLNRIPGDMGSADMLGYDLASLKVGVRSSTTLSETPAEGLIFGYDVPRNLLVIKIAHEDVERLGLKKAPLAGFSAVVPDQVCIAGFRFESASAVWRVEAQDGLEPRAGRDIRWSLRYAAHAEEIGSAVLDPRTGALVGIVTEQEGQETRYLPIEYADTLLSQVFLARIVRELEVLNRTASDLQTTVGWTYQIINEQNGIPTIRFVFQQYARGLVVERVRILTRVVGRHKDIQGRGDVPLNDPKSDPIKPGPGENYVDYTPERFLEQAMKLGYAEVDTLSVTLYVEFAVPDGMTPIRSTQSTFELPVKITLQAIQ